MSYDQQPGYPNNQSGASWDPASQASAGYPGGQSSASYPSSQPSGTYGGPQDQGGWAPQPQGPLPQGQPGQTPGFFGKIFDFTFNHYVTPSLIKILYILGIVMGVLQWLGTAGVFFMMGIMQSGNSYTADFAPVLFVVGFLALLFGVVPLFFWILSLRTTLEIVMANVRTQEDTAAIRKKLDA